MKANTIRNALVLITSHFSSSLAQVNVYCNVQNSNGASVSNQGLSYGYYDTNPYRNTASGNVAPAQRYPAYDPTFVNNLAPIYQGQTSYIGFPLTSGTTRVYPDSPLHVVQNITVVHRGYLYARTSGTYTFTSSVADEIVLTWVGDTAYSGYNRANAVEELATSSSQTAISYSIPLTAGQYLPFRIQYTNAQGDAALTYSITDPAGTVLLSRTVSTDIVTQPCDGSAIFPPLYSGNPICAGDSSLSTDGTGNRGLQYGIWNSSTRSTDSSFSTYPVTAFDGTAAVHLGVTNRLYVNVPAGPGDSGSVVPIYQDTTQRFYSAFITIIHRGYLYARTSGSYSFSITSADDIALVWVGNNAVSGFTRANANSVFVTSNNPNITPFTVFLNAGQYLPIRIQWDNAQGGAGLSMIISNGEGEQLLNSTAMSDFYYPSCPGETSNGNAIPQFGRWFQNSTSYTTVTSAASTDGAAGTSTTTLAQPTGTDPGTIVVIVPRTYTTITTTASDASATETVTTTLADPSGSNPGTVELIVPRVYTTITSTAADGSVTGTVTTTLAEPSGANPGTVQIIIPATYTTITEPNTFTDNGATGTFTTTLAQPSGTQPGTVAVVTPASYITTVAPYTGTSGITQAITSTVARPSGTAPGTVVVYTPTSSSMTSIMRPATITTTFASNTCTCTPVAMFRRRA